MRAACFKVLDPPQCNNEADIALRLRRTFLGFSAVISWLPFWTQGNFPQRQHPPAPPPTPGGDHVVASHHMS